MSSIGVGTYAEVFNETEAQVQTQTVTEQIGLYVRRDLTELIRKGNVDIAANLRLPRTQRPNHSELLVEWLCHDIEKLVRNRLILRVHFILCAEYPDARNQYRVGYHVRYVIASRQFDAHVILDEFNGRIRPPANIAQYRKFILMLDWDPQSHLRDRERVKPPEYIFHWVPPKDRLDLQHLVLYREGGLGADTLYVERAESGLPNDVPPSY